MSMDDIILFLVSYPSQIDTTGLVVAGWNTESLIELNTLKSEYFSVYS